MNESTNSFPQQPNALFIPLNPNYGMLKAVLLSLITLGIYGFFFLHKLSSDINRIASPSDGKKTMNGALMMFLTTAGAFIPIVNFFIFILPLIWYHTVSDRIGDQLRARQQQYSFGAGTYWGWAFFGAFILIGPFVYLYKLCYAMNLLCDNYNANHA